jgi:signal transduction histidine kinase
MASFRAPASVLRVLRQRTLRTQLALLYAGVFVVLGVALLAVSGLLVGRGSTSVTGHSSSQSFFAGRHFQVGPALAFAGAALVALGLGWLIAGRLLRPLRTITATARDISASNLNRRLALASRDEFSALGETLDGLFERLEDSFDSQRHFVANASHELRTPLAAERTLLQVALADPDASAQSLRATCEQVLALGDQQERLIDALLTLASSERGVDEWRSFDLAEVTRAALLGRQSAADDRGIRVSATLASAPASGDPSLADCLIANLVENAIRHNVAGGTIDVSTRTADGRAIVAVSNTGPLVPLGDVSRLIQPFQRLGADRIRPGDRSGQAGGSGLGLAIVRAIADAHKATLTVQARTDGGLAVEVSFPNGRQLGPNSSPANSPE